MPHRKLLESWRKQKPHLAPVSHSLFFPLCTLAGQDCPLSGGSRTNDQRVEGRAVQQGGRRVPRGHLLQPPLCPDLGKADRRHPGVQETQEDGHHGRVR